MSAALLLSVSMAGTASAGVAIPPFPGQSGAPVAGFGLYPNWLPQSSPGVDPISNVNHSEGSDTTLFVMQQISDLYNQAGIAPFSCTITKTANSNCQQPSVSTPNPNNTQSDETDNFSGTEELQGTNDVGSGNGQNELCNGTPAAPAGTVVDYARSSKPVGSPCTTGVEVGFAKDAVISVDFLNIDPQAYGTPSGYQTQVDPQCTSSGGGFYPSYAKADGTVVCTQFPTGGIGSVADGWLPGDSFTCGATNTCSGTPFTDIDNTPINSGTGATSVAYRLFCQHGPSATPDTSQVTDWGQLTNLSAAHNGGVAQPLGDGAPIGVPINIIGINPGSGTVATEYAFAQSGIGSGTNCNGGVGTVSSGSVDVNATSGPDPQANQGPAGGTGNTEVAVENDANQIGDFAAANFATATNCDAADQAVSIATSLYSMSYGAYVTNPNASVASIEQNSTCTSGQIPSGLPSTFSEKFGKENNKSLTNTTEGGNAYPMARTVFNIYRTDTVKASVGGFLNWMCDSNSSIQKGTNHIEGANFDSDVTNVIQGQYGFIRLTDKSSELSVAQQTPADNVPAGGPNGTCDANLSVSSITAGNPVVTMSGTVPSSVQVGWTVTVPPGSSVTIPSGDTIQSISGTQITLNSAPTAGTSGGPTPNLYFPGQAPVLAVANLGS